MKRFRILLLAVFTALLFGGNAYSQDYIEINGLRWDKENIGNLIGQEEAISRAEKAGKRLPTKEEFASLWAMGSTWDDDLNGRWFGEDHAIKSNSKKSIFFPASGYRLSLSGGLSRVGSGGYYWSSTPSSTALGYFLYFFGGGAYPSTIGNRAYGLSVRCVR